VAQCNIYGECSIGSGKTIKLIELPFGMVNGVGLRNHALDAHAHWHQLKNTVKQLFKAAMSGSAIRSGDAASSQITLGNINGDPDYHRYTNKKHAKACKSTSSMADAFTMSDTNVQISCFVPAIMLFSMRTTSLSSYTPDQLFPDRFQLNAL